MYIEEMGFVQTGKEIKLTDGFKLPKHGSRKTDDKASQILYENDAEIIVSDYLGRVAYFSKYLYSITGGAVDNDIFTSIDRIKQTGYTDIEYLYYYINKLDTHDLVSYVIHYKTPEPWFKDMKELIVQFREYFALSILDYDVRISLMYNTMIFNIVSSNLLLFITPTNIISTIQTPEHEDVLVALLNALVSIQDIEELDYEIMRHDLKELGEQTD